MPLIPAFQLHLGDPILQGLATVGKYDGKHPSLTCATSGGKIFIHSPHSQREAALATQVKYLNINKQISAVAAGELDRTLGRELLLVGTHTDLLAYDVEENADHFFKEVTDGVNTMLFGNIANIEPPLAIVGGNCSLQGFDHEGNELFWTVTGDNVTALAIADVDGDGQVELLVGSDDYEIRIFQNEDVISECTEADRVVGLCAMHDTLFGYALGNGTVGVYDKSTRVWRVKSKNQVMAVNAFDLDADGVPELIGGWSNGKVEVRQDRTGEVVYRDHFTSPVSAVLTADYRNDGREEVICCGLDGEIRGYLPAENENRGNLMDANVEEESLVDLSQRKQELLYELQAYESNMRTVTRKAEADDTSSTVIPANTRVTSMLEMNPNKQCCDLLLSTNNECVIKGVIIFAEQLFERESLFNYQRVPNTVVRVPLSPRKDVCADMLIKVMVGTRTSPIYHVFEVDYRLPKFAMYVPIRRDQAPEPVSSVTFHITERINRVNMWLEASFSVPVKSDGDQLDVTFVSLRDGKPMTITMNMDNGGTVVIKTDDMDVAGEVIQDLCSYLDISELESLADFPYEMEAFRNVLLKVDEYNAVRLKLTAEMADSSNLVKTLVIKAEDARILNNMTLMKRMYQNLYDVNRELIMEHTKRSTNHAELLAALKEVNQMIQKAARLRVGTAKTRVVAACRNAIKSNNIHSLFKIMKMGDTA